MFIRRVLGRYSVFQQSRSLAKLEANKNRAQSSIAGKPESSMKKHFKLISWNIDGLDRLHETLEMRTRRVVAVIEREKPDAVFLQEVIPQSLILLRNLLPEYEAYIGNRKGYFVVILTRQAMIKVKDYKVIPFSCTNMNRNLLIVHAIYEGTMKIDLTTSHLESCEPAAGERIQQLKFCFQKMVETLRDRMVFFGGDLNLLDSELKQAGNIPPGISDVWIETGECQKYAYTWDMKLNTNLGFTSDNPPRCRFDRLYIRPATSSMFNLRPVSFKLEGQEMIPSIQRFCSDHWAIQAKFEISPSS